MITELCIKTYRFFSAHKGVYLATLVALFGVFGYFGTQIRLEEDLGKLMPSSKNADGTTKLAFADLKIKDITYLLFEGENTADVIATCDAFVDSLQARDAARVAAGKPSMVGNLFYRIPMDELLPDAIDYMTAHLPAYIDTSFYARLDTLLTPQHIQELMQQNLEDRQGEFGQMYDWLLDLDPIGLRHELQQVFMPVVGDLSVDAEVDADIDIDVDIEGTSATLSESESKSESESESKSKSKSTGGYITIDEHIFAADSSLCIVFITPKASANNTGQGSAMFECINDLIDQFSGDVNIWYHGTPASGYYNSSTIKHDLVFTVGGAFVIVLIVLLLFFRRLRVIPLMALPVAFGTLFALSIMYFVKGEFSLLALGIGGVILGVALSYALHVLVHQAYVGDPEQVLRDETKPILLGCVTTIGSFMGLIFVHTDLLRDFGIFASLAIVGTTVFSLIWLPMLLPRTAKNMPAVVNKMSTFPADRSKVLLALVAVLTVFCVGAFMYGGVQFDENMHNIGYKHQRLERSEQLLASKSPSDDKSKFFAASGKTMEEALDNYQLLKEKLDSLQATGVVKSYSHKSDVFIPLATQQARIDAWKAYWTPERQDLLHQLINEAAPKARLVNDPEQELNAEAFDAFFTDLVDADFEPSPLYNDSIIPAGFLATMVEHSNGGDYLCFTSVTFRKQDSSVEDSDYHRICRAVANEPNMMVLDTYFYTRDTLKQLNSDFTTLQWISLLFVLVVLFFSFHYNMRHSLLGFMPIALSWLIVLGAMFLFGRSFNLINIIISTFIFGVGVDYSIFVMNGLVSGEPEKLQYHRTAILLSAVILLITVGSMVLAKHPAIQSVGFSTLVGLVSAVVLAWVLQPTIYRVLEKKRKE